MKSKILSAEKIVLGRSFFFSLLFTAVITTARAQLTKTIGAGGDYANLKTAFDSINAGAIKGDLILQLTSNTTEPAYAILNASGSGSSSYTSVLIQPDSGKTITVTGNVSAGSLIQLNGAAHVLIDGSWEADTSRKLTIINSSSSGQVILYKNSASNNVIRNTILRGSGENGEGVIMFSSTTSTGNNYNLIEGNEIDAGGRNISYGVYNDGTKTDSTTWNTNDTIRGNVIHHFNSTGIFDTGGSKGMVYSGNEIYNDSASSATASGFACMGLGIYGFSFTANYIHDLTGNNATVPSACGIYLGDVSPSATCLVANNRIVMNPDSLNNTLFGIYDNPTVNGMQFEIVYNTVVISGSSAAGGNTNSGAYARGKNSSTKLFNNIFENSRTSTNGYQAAIFLIGTGNLSSLVTNLTSDYNDLYVPASTSFSNVVYFNSTLLPLSSWKLYSKDAHSFNIKPAFINPYSDLHLKGTYCLLDGKGTPVKTTTGFIYNVTKDFENDARNDSFPDIGADEYAGSPLPAPVLTLSHDTIYCTPAAFYKWYRNGILIPSATDSIYVITGDGSYNVYVSDSNGCGSFGNAVLITSATGLTKDEVTVYPNPVSNVLWVNAGVISYELQNIYGENIPAPPITQNSNLKTGIDVSSLSPGIYILTVHTDKGYLKKKIIVGN